MESGRVFYAEVQILDRQLVDRDGRMAGKVDDAELSIDEDGSAHLSTLLSGPGVLARRLGHHTYGGWREHLERALEPGHAWTTRIALRHVREWGVTIVLGLARDDLASFGTERWTRDHVINHIPGARDGG